MGCGGQSQGQPLLGFLWTQGQPVHHAFLEHLVPSQLLEIHDGTGEPPDAGKNLGVAEVSVQGWGLHRIVKLLRQVSGLQIALGT